ncbi:hypothetical protein [Mycobacteroides salmoniphilum]|uniref:DUF7882 family protein n=1 Tax=Mycobacteroides salmoniphilum TaxID=404941 RepID=UPI001065F48E|nr:hypothetical protein [Mycobacteroides salmoniphilum]TDZ91133.1 hypothetical protein CCUG62472_04392 [Mycobacteroides salmoniphilum]
MGQLIYAGSSYDIYGDGFVLLDVLTRNAFEEGKSFTVVLRGVTEHGETVARSLWLSPHIPVQFLYQDYETLQIPRDTFAELYDSVIESGIYFLGDGPLPYEFTGEHSSSDGD